MTKAAFRDTLNHIINEYSYKISNCNRRDYITRTFIFIFNKFNLNENPQFIDYNTFTNELEKTIALMTGNLHLNSDKELICFLENIDFNESNQIMI